MKDSVYLYGSNYNAKTLRELPYLSALYRKVHWSQELVEELNKEPLFLQQYYYDLETGSYVKVPRRDFRRINASLESQKFNRKLIAEMFEGDKE